MESGHGFYGGQQEKAIEVCGFGKKSQKLVEAPAEDGECWGIEAGATSTIQPIVGIGREI